MQSINPATGQIIETYQTINQEQLFEKVELSQQAFRQWKRSTFEERSKAVLEAARILRANSEEYAKLMVDEMGKPIAQGRSEIEKCAWVCEYYAQQGPEFLADEVISTDAKQSYVSYQPLGIVLAIMPWNFPFWQVFRFTIPAIMAGNAFC